MKPNCRECGNQITLSDKIMAGDNGTDICADCVEASQIFHVVKVFDGPIGSPFRLHRANILMQAQDISGVDDDSLNELSSLERSDKHTIEEWQKLEDMACAVLRTAGPKRLNAPNHKITKGQMVEDRERGHHPFTS